MPVPSFDPVTTTFSLSNGYYLAQAAQAAYDADPGPGLTGFMLTTAAQVCCANNLSGYVGTFNGGNDILVAFRGTVADDISNWLTDDCIVQKSDAAYPGMVHTGFAETMYSVWPLINAKLPALAPGQRVWVTGHSLGGAMATLAALRLKTAGFNAIALYTYGSPRVGNTDFYQEYSVPHYRFVNNCDVVPHVPSEELLIGFRSYTYKHVGTLEYLDRNGHLGGGMSNWEEKKEYILDTLRLNNGPWPGAVADHFIANYITAIAANF